MELCEKGDLYHQIKNKVSFTWPQRWKISYDIASGLRYLHSRHIIHCDLKSPNILLTSDYTPKITDFGITKIKEHSKTLLQKEGLGSVPWMPPEFTQRELKVSEAADVYGMGVIFWEIAAGKEPWLEFKSMSDIWNAVRGGKRPVINKDWPSTFQNIITLCWHGNRKSRPTAHQVQTLLDLGKSKPNLSIAGIKKHIDPNIRLFFDGLKKLEKGKSKQEKKEGFESIKKAADNGHLEAIYQCGICYKKGLGSKQNLKTADEYFRRSSTRNHAASYYELGFLLRSQKQQSINCFQKAAQLGHGESEWIYGNFLFHGKGVKQNKPLGLGFIKKAADKHVLEATYRYGRIAMAGSGIKKDSKMALDYLKKAADLGHTRAAYYTAELLLSQDKNNPSNQKLALQYYRQSASKTLGIKI